MMKSQTTTRRTKRSSTASSSTASSWSHSTIIVGVIVILWLLTTWLSWGYSVLNDNNGPAAKGPAIEETTEKNKKKIAITLLSQNATVTADVRGNLGDAAVVLTDPNGTDWLKDRWQAASDLHGTEIRGAHWVRLEFAPHIIVGNDHGGGGIITSIILDWETAYSDDYQIDGLVRVWPPVVLAPQDTMNGAADEQKAASTMMIPLFDSKQQKNDSSNFKTRSYGQSPGVPQKLPLHVIHEIDMTTTTTTTMTGSSSNNTIATTTTTTGTKHRTTPLPLVCYGILLTIRSPFHKGWGVSLWSIQVYGMIATT
jgi:hypothetical protein